MQLSIAILLLAAVTAANLPFLSRKVLLVIPIKNRHFGWRFLEWGIWLMLTWALACFLESRYMPIHSQKWPFYVANIALFIVFAFPGFIYRYFWRNPGR